MGEAKAAEPPPPRGAHRWLSPWAFTAVLTLGIALRLGLFLRNRALWLDESFVALNVIHRDFGGLAQALDYRQGAPLAYLWVVKALAKLCGPNEYALRAVSLVAGVAAFVGVYFLGRRIVDRLSLLMALGICAVSLPLIRYASELKQYSLDVLAAVVFAYAGLSCADGPIRWPRLAGFIAVGLLAPWFSHSSLFVAAGVFSTLLARTLWQREWNHAFRVGLVALAWGFSFAANFVLVLRHTAEDEVVRSWWLSAYLPRPFYSPSAVKWVWWSFTDLFGDPLGLVLPGLGALCFVLGWLTLHAKRPIALALLAAPLGFALLAAALQRYPFTGRFLLFAVPALALIAGVGAAALGRLLWRFSRSAGVAFAILLFGQPILLAVNAVMDEPRSGMRPVIETLRNKRVPAEPLYLYHWAQFEFLYYAELGGYETGEFRAGDTARNDWSRYQHELDAYRGRGRVWFVFNTVAPILGEGEEQYFLTRLEEMGEKVEEYRWKEVRLYCFSIDPASPKTNH